MENDSRSLPVLDIVSLEGSVKAGLICIAFFCLLVYEWLITLDEEISYFWSGPWNVSRSLFLVNRYFTLIISIVPIVCIFTPNPTDDFQVFQPHSWAIVISCRPALKSAFISDTVVMGLVQAILAVRVWYLYSSSKLIQAVVIISLAVSIIASLTLSGIAAANLDLIPSGNLQGCHVKRPDDHWRLFLPPFFLHTLLFVFTAMKALQSYRILDTAPIIKRLLRDGGGFYVVAFVSIGLTVIGSILRDQTQLNIISIFANFVVPLNSIAVSRVMLSIHSLASSLGADSAYLLNNLELSRVARHWRAGATPGEIIVDTWKREEEEWEMRAKA